MGPFINNNGSGCIPTGGEDSWNFQISEGPSKAPETGYSVSPDPIREQWSMRLAKKRPKKRKELPNVTCNQASHYLQRGSPIRLLTAYVIIGTRRWSHWFPFWTQMLEAPVLCLCTLLAKEFHSYSNTRCDNIVLQERKEWEYTEVSAAAWLGGTVFCNCIVICSVYSARSRLKSSLNIKTRLIWVAWSILFASCVK